MPADQLTYLTRPVAGDAEGLLVLFHGRGADERDLYPLLDLLDPERRLLGVTPRGPLSLPPGGAHWYALHEIGYRLQCRRVATRHGRDQLSVRDGLRIGRHG